ncbi:phospholipase B, putative [Entamoeba histolytica HM-1:IMSS-B]|uniref:Phospholipase B-like n=5 Tax=Entamoeba histolytica TaxID=5759 RepID=C4M934_ENTH1|nr:hypothetical protein, conserved [Entamoeba histolytica HM-1:IMSS]EMD43228.1 phospholipase, putative [Entamoeba histolytica KU27]EMH74016.1 phospholipase B, putative [Entamoeba histolytica HM-1:IMSS-B]ENY64494.1 phospholipase B protein, putative [Entamoeba histolytica HM-1:IMSS-A]GAT98149.1 phospholipase b putative [Entamoeba histolytica]EAL44037.1 hypothetical protein, conserved [Entamoeba histolytica HM-1:IMSS]|eukprot:XP_649424.1 hypothetical protein, conserved [Entamoeba histolytica HM-1:IMSS]
MFVLALISLVSASTYYSVLHKSEGIYKVVPGRFADACAVGYYDDTIQTTGWGQLYIRSNFKLAETEQSYCSGYLEAYLTHHYMYLYWTNYKANEYENGQPSNTLINKMQEQLDFFKTESSTNTNEYWRRQKVIKYQFNGLVDGYMAASPAEEELPEIELYMLLSVGDLENLNEIYKTGKEPETSIVYMRKAFPDRIYHECSALVRAVGDEVYFAHGTWRGYYAMLRIYKVYDLFYGGRRLKMSFSSSPGLIHSKDDYYTVSAEDTQLFVSETTNSVYNSSVYEDINDKLLSWQRILSGLYYEKTAKEFVELIKDYNSGTYNNQWIVFDVNSWKKNKAESLFICEQMPGLMKSHDVTEYLTSEEKQNMWPSYNVPFDKEIYSKSGYPTDHDEYTSCSRAKIFNRDVKNVQTIEDMKHIMLYNDYQNDEFSKNDPKESIASRYDLRVDRPNAFGAIDAKIVSTSNPHLTYAISGPTHQGQPVFEWTQQFKNVHVGVPEKFDFDWVEINDKQ